MPLRATIKDKEIFSYKISSNEWNELKRSESRRLLTLACCGNRAIAKTSPLGTQFFAHHRKSIDCLSKPESKEHLRIKAIVASAAESVGWGVTTEFIGESTKGEKWIADVYCTRGKAKVALEIQLSHQTNAELNARHRKYENSGVRDCWLMKENVYKNSGDMSIKAFPRFSIKNFEEDKTPLMSNYKITIKQFVKQLLTGGVEWKEDIDSKLIYYMKSICWKCSKNLKIPVGIDYTENSNFDNFIKTVPNCSTFYEKLIKKIGGSRLENLGLTTIGPNPHMKGNAPNFPFCVKCTRCYAPQSNHHTLQSFIQWRKNNNHVSHYVTYTKYHNNGRYELKS